jgi:chromosomal replication initiator protein
MSMYLCRQLTQLTLEKIANYFHKDHSSVINAEKKIKKLMGEKPQIYDQVQDLIKQIRYNNT